MRLLKTRLFIALTLFIIYYSLFITLHAQSIFSPFGPADLSYQRDAIGEGMGGTGVGDMYRFNASFINPALSVNMMRTTFTTALSMGNVTYKDKSSGSFADNQIYMPYFNLVIPLKQSRFGFNYNTIGSGRLSLMSEDESERQTSDFALYKAGVFWANRNVNLHFALGVNYIFGHNKTFARMSFTDTDVQDIQMTEDYIFKNAMFNVGVAKNLGTVSLGAAASYPLPLQGKGSFSNRMTTNDVTYTLNSSTSLGNAEYELPPQLSVGWAFKPRPLFHIAMDLDYEHWEWTENFPDPQNTFRLGIGAAWAGYPLSKKFLAIFPVRAGFSVRNLPFKINDEMIYEMGYHFGLSIPLKGYDSYLDVAAKIYNRGDADKHGYSDSGFLITIGTNGFDFLRSRQNRKLPREIPLPDDGRSQPSGGQRGSSTGGRRSQETTPQTEE